MVTPIRVGLVGCGLGASKHLPAYERHREVVQVAAVCDVNAAAAGKVAARLGLPAGAVYGELGAMLRGAAGGEIDAVDICTVHDQHYGQAMAAIAAGKHVLVEKPMALAMEDCRAMVAAAASAGKILMVAHNQRFRADYRAIKKVIESGELGRIHSVLARSQLDISRVPAGHWVFDGGRAGGGVAMTLGLNLVDLCRWVVGEIASVKAATCRRDNPAFSNGAEDQVSAILEFQGGAAGRISASYATGPAGSGGGGGSEMLEVYGERGTVGLSGKDDVWIASEARGMAGRRREGEAFMAKALESLAVEAGADDMYGEELLHFAQCVRDGREPLCSGREILGTMGVVFGIYEMAGGEKRDKVKG